MAQAVFAAFKIAASFVARHAIATAIVNIAVSAGASYIANALRGRGRQNQNLLDPNQFNRLFSDPLSERVIIYGETGLAGEVVFQQVHSDKKWISYVIDIADNGQSQAHTLTKVLIDGDEITFDGSGNEIGSYAGAMKLRFYGGTQTAADAQLVTSSGGIWTSAHIGKGLVYAVWSIDLANDKKFPNGRPDIIFVIKGRRLYDRREDSTAGGVSGGTHRLNDDATWEWSDNWALCVEDFARGVKMGATPKFVAGLKLPVSLIDTDWTNASANASDSEGWTINGPVLTGSDPAEVLNSMARHAGGRITTRKGRFAAIAGYDWPSALTITSNDLAGAFKLNAFKGWRETHNVIRATYRDLTANFEAVETNPIRVADWITEDDGQEFETGLDLPFSNDRELSTRLAKIHLYRERAPRAIESPFKLRCAQAGEGDFVTVNIPEYGINEKYEIVTRALDALGFVTLGLQSYDPAPALTWSSAEAGDPPAFDTIDRFDYTPPDPISTAPDSWAVAGESQVGVGGTIPALRVTGTPLDWVHSVVIEYREDVSPAGAWALVYDGPPGAVGSPLITGVAPGVSYDVSIRYRFGRRYSTNRLILTATSSATLSAGSADSVAWSDVTDDDGHRPDNDADVTATHTAAAIASQGALATLNQVNLGASGRVYRDDGATRVTDALAITSLGTAAAIASQGSLATRNTVAASHIDANAVTAAKVSAAAITASKLSASDRGNMLLDPDFEDAAYWGGTGTWTFGSTDTKITTGLGAKRGIKSDAGNGTTSQASGFFQTQATALMVEPGKRYRIAARILVEAGFTGLAYIQCNWFKQDGTSASTAATSVTASGNDFRAAAAGAETIFSRDGIVTAPADAHYALFAVLIIWSTTLNNAGRAYFAHPRVHRATEYEMLPQGVLTASKHALTDTANMVADPDFLDSTYWALGTGWTFGSTDAGVTTTLGAKRGLKSAVGNGTTSQANSGVFGVAANYQMVEPGASYRVCTKFLAKAGFTGAAFLRLSWFKQDGSAATGTATTFISGNDYRTVAAGADTVFTRDNIATAPADAYYARFDIGVAWSTTLNNAQYCYAAIPRMHRAAKLGTMVTREDGATAVTDATAVTSLGTAAAISGQGALATLNQANLGASGRVYRDDGTTRLTDALAVTSLGTAAAIASQGALATKNTAATADLAASAVSDVVTDETTNTTWTDSAWHEIAAISVTGLASSDQLILMGSANFNSTYRVGATGPAYNYGTHSVRLKKNGSVIRTWGPIVSHTYPSSTSGVDYPAPAAFSFLDLETGNTGDVAFTIEAMLAPAGYVSFTYGGSCSEASLIGLKLKR